MSVCMGNRRSRWAVLAAGCGLWTGEHATPTGSSEEPEERSLSLFRCSKFKLHQYDDVFESIRRFETAHSLGCLLSVRKNPKFYYHL